MNYLSGLSLCKFRRQNHSNMVDWTGQSHWWWTGI